MPTPNRRKTQPSAFQKLQQKKASAKAKSLGGSIDAVIDSVQTLKGQYMFDQCLKSLTKALKQYSNDPRIYELLFLLGEVYLEQGDSLNSSLFLKQAIQANPKHYPSLMYLGQISEGTDGANYFSKGLAVIQELLQGQNEQDKLEELKGLYVQGLCSVCELYMTDLCFEPNAEQECEKCVEMAKQFYNNVPLDNWDINLLQTLAHLRMCQCKPEEGKHLMQYVAKKVIDEGNRLKEATEHSYSDLIMGYDFKLSTAKNLIELQMYQDAKTILEQLKDQFDEVVDLWYLLGVCADSLGQGDMAIKHMEKALKIGHKVKEDGLFLKEIKEELDSIKKRLSDAGQMPRPEDLIDEDDEAWEDVVEEAIEDGAMDDDDEEMNG